MTLFNRFGQLTRCCFYPAVMNDNNGFIEGELHNRKHLKLTKTSLQVINYKIIVTFKSKWFTVGSASCAELGKNPTLIVEQQNVFARYFCLWIRLCSPVQITAADNPNVRRRKWTYKEIRRLQETSNEKFVSSDLTDNGLKISYQNSIVGELINDDNVTLDENGNIWTNSAYSA